MRIAYIGIKGLPSRGGAERAVEAIVERLKFEHDITVYCNAMYTPANYTLPGVHLIRVPAVQGKYTYMTSVDFLSACHAVFLGKYDIIHLHNIETCFILPILRLRYKVISTAHGFITEGNKWGRISRRLMRGMEWPYAMLSNAVTSVSLSDATVLNQKYHRNMRYVPNGVDISINADITEATKLLVSYGAPSEDYILFAADRILPLKGLHVLLEAYRDVEPKRPLIVIGNLTSPEYSERLQVMASPNVFFIPFVRAKSVFFGVLKKSSLVVMPSLNEAMSMALLEAASLGLPIICSDIPANKSVFGDDHVLFFKAGDAKDLNEKLRRALNHPQETREIGKAAQAWVRENFSWDIIAEQYHKLYTSIANKGIEFACL